MTRDMDLMNGNMVYESSETQDLMKSDSSLMKGIAQGNPDDMEIFMDRYLPMVSRVSYRILCDIHESEEVTKEVFMKVWRSAGEYDFRHGVSLWMYRMIYNLCYIHIRRTRFLDLLSFHPSVYETSAPQPLSPEEDYITKETWGIYCRASRFLTIRQRVVFVLLDLEELQEEDVSELMNMRIGRIREKLTVAREKIKEELSRYGKVV